MVDMAKVQESMRDIQLLAVGYGLNKEVRKQLLGELPQGICCAEVEQLLNAYRTGKPDNLLAWLSGRRVKVENGQTPIQAITNTINAQHKRAKLQEVLSTVKFAAQLEDPNQVITDLKEAIQKLEQM